MAFQYLRFSKGDVFGDPDIYEVTVDNESLNVIRENFGLEDTIQYRIDDAADWIKLIEEMRINQWDDSYIDPNMLDGIVWELVYVDDEKGRKFTGGSNAYPRDWTLFLVLMQFLDTELMKQIEHE